MKKNKVKIFSASEKTGIVLELIKEESTLGQLASKYAISSKTIQNWQKQFLGNTALAFEPAKVLSEYQEQVNAPRGKPRGIYGDLKVEYKRSLLHIILPSP